MAYSTETIRKSAIASVSKADAMLHYLPLLLIPAMFVLLLVAKHFEPRE